MSNENENEVTPERLQEIKNWSMAATPGEWIVNGLADDYLSIEGTAFDGKAIYIAKVPREAERTTALEQVANARLIAVSKEIVATIESLQARIKVLEAERQEPCEIDFIQKTERIAERIGSWTHFAPAQMQVLKSIINEELIAPKETL